MRLFINDFPVRIIDEQKNIDDEFFHDKIDASIDSIYQNRLIHHVLIQNMTLDQFDELLHSLHKYVVNNLYSLTIVSKDYEQIVAYLNEKYKVIRAAGGLVQKKDKLLMIYRLKKWDLPKGKLNKGEEPRQGAIREVEEECNIKVRLEHKLCTTYHTYTMKNKDILKKTTWYLMTSLNDSNKKPQIEEDIEELKWMSPKEVHHALQNSYQSIAYVFNKFYNTDNTTKADKVKNY